MLRKAAITIAFLIPVSAAAQEFRSSNDLIVRPLSATSFEVLGTRASHAKSYWCAASDYVRDRLGDPARVRITVVSPPGSLSSGARNVGFSIAADAAKGQSASNSVSVGNVGASVSPTLAGQFCDDLDRQNRGL